VTISRNQVVQCWGTPATTVGSVNEPREMEEHGLRFNEKWVYRLAPATPEDAAERIVYWQRYDFVASRLVRKNGEVEPEDASALVSARRDRRYHPPGR
jgi:hypothetical protein